MKQLDDVFLKVSAAAFILVFIYGVLLSLRPISGEFSDNDTGRYVINYWVTCASPISFDARERITWELYNLIIRPSCIFQSERVYMLINAIFLPLILFFHTRNSLWSILVASSLIFSQIGFELITNAFRQNASLCFVIIAFLFRSRLMFGGSLIIAVGLHDSSISYLPVFLLMRVLQEGGRLSLKWILIGLTLVCAVLTLAIASFSEVYLSSGDETDLGEVFTKKYIDEQPLIFQIYNCSPFVFVFILRYILLRNYLSYIDYLIFLYSLLLCSITIVYYPFITYRFAMTAFVVQILSILRPGLPNQKIAGLVFVFSIVHFVPYLLYSTNVKMMFEGYVGG